MPPQSRGGSPLPGAFSDPEFVPPTLRPYLDNLPSPSTIILDQATPTASKPNGDTSARETPTPTGHRRSQNDNASEEQDTDEVTIEYKEDENEGEEDDEFESHYSRHSSPASSTSGSEDRDDLSKEIGVEDAKPLQQRNRYDASDRPLQRINSLPVSSSIDGNGHLPTAISQIHMSQSTTSLPPRPPPPPPLYPPFYNRPPTPLPPSPSLTSLLRPPSLLNRSTTSTRPTTPDSSDVETPNDTEAAVAHSARRAHPLPPTAPKVPTYEYYGFVLYLGSSLAFLMYLLWSYLPSPFLHALGITYYPNRWWSLAIPAWIVMVLVFVYVALLSYNVEYLTLPLASLECMVDEAGNVAVLDQMGRIRKGGNKKFVQEMQAEMKRKKEEEEKFQMKHRKGDSWSRGHYGSKGKGWKKKGKDRQHDEDGLTKRKKGKAESSDSYYGIVGLNGDAQRQQQQMNGLGAASPVAFNWKQVWNEGTDGVMDVPIGGVCQILYVND